MVDPMAGLAAVIHEVCQPSHTITCPVSFVLKVSSAINITSIFSSRLSIILVSVGLAQRVCLLYAYSHTQYMCLVCPTTTTCSFKPKMSPEILHQPTICDVVVLGPQIRYFIANMICIHRQNKNLTDENVIFSNEDDLNSEQSGVAYV